jgi:hypothetical protein
MTEPDRKLRRSFVVYDKRTGELVGAHQISVAEGADLPATSDLVRLVLRTAATDKRSSARLAVLEHGSAIADPSRYSVNIRTGRLVEKRRARLPRRSPR